MSKTAQSKPSYSNLVFREDFRSLKKVADNKGIITGTPVINNGITLSGTGQYVIYQPPLACNNITKFSIRVRFKADLTSGNDGILNFGPFSGSGGELEVFISANNLYLRTKDSANSTGFAFTSTDWNFLTVSYDGTNAALYLNDTFKGNLATAALNFNDVQLVLGAYWGTGYSFDGQIDFVEIYNKTLSAAEISDLNEYDTYSEVDPARAELWLPLRTHYDSGSAEVTDNIGSLGGTVTWGDGTTSTTYPTQLNPHGISFDGGDYVDLSDLNTYIGHDKTFSFVWVGIKIAGTNGYILGNVDSATRGSEISYMTNQGIRCYFWDGAGNYFGKYHALLDVAKTGVFAVTYDGTGSAAGIKVYFNGELIASTTQSAGTVSSTTASGNTFLGCDGNLGNKLASGNKIKKPILFNFVLTPAQIKYLNHKLMSELNV